MEARAVGDGGGAEGGGEGGGEELRDQGVDSLESRQNCGTTWAPQPVP